MLEFYLGGAVASLLFDVGDQLHNRVGKAARMLENKPLRGVHWGGAVAVGCFWPIMVPLNIWAGLAPRVMAKAPKHAPHVKEEPDAGRCSVDGKEFRGAYWGTSRGDDDDG